MSTDYENMRVLNRLAVEAGIDVVMKAGPEDLGRATPCAAWDLGQLLAHMTAQHRAFAAAMDGGARTLDAWQPVPLGPDPAGEYAAAARLALDAFDAPDAADRQVVLPEITRQSAFPAPLAIGFHFVDAVVHTWDVARALDLPYEPSEEVTAPAFAIALMVPDGDYRLGEAPVFRPRLPDPDPAGSTLDRVLRTLGRSPSWPDAD